jgi:hypothetical protein
LGYQPISHTENIAYDVEDASDAAIHKTSIMLLGISVTFGCRIISTLNLVNEVRGRLTCVCTKVWTDDCKVDHSIDPTNDEKDDGHPKKPHNFNRQPKRQSVEEVHKRKLDKVERSPIERREHEAPHVDVQDSRNILSEKDCEFLIHGANEI